MPTPQFGYTRDERAYALLESAYGLTPNTNGVSSLSGSNCFSLISIDLDPDVDLYEAEYKTGSRSMIQGQPGRKVGSFRISIPLKGSGTPGVPADYSPILISALGVRTIVPGTNVIYSLQDNPANTFSLYRFRTPSVLCQQLGISCIPTRVTWTIGQNMANWSVEGQCMWVQDSEQFPSADTIGRGGLTSFPTEPTSPVTNGIQAQGFVGSISMDGNVLANIQQMTITANLGWSQNRTFFGSYYPTDILGGIRQISGTIEAFDDASAAMMDLRAKGLSKAPIAIYAQVGNVPGNTHQFTCNNCQLSYPSLSDSGDRFGARLNFTAHETSAGLRDEYAFVEY